VRKLEVFFDCSSPWSYLAFHNIQPMAAELSVPVTWRPILVGGVFNAVNPNVYNSRDTPVPAKKAQSAKDLQDWARYSGLTIIRPTVFPVNSVKAMRICCALELAGDAKLEPFARACFASYWGDDQDISQIPVLRAACATAGLDADAMLAATDRQEVKDRLRNNTQELMDRGGYGSPTIFVNTTDMYFGNDRIPLVRAALQRAA